MSAENTFLFYIVLVFLGCGLSEDQIKTMAEQEFNRKAELFRKEKWVSCNKSAELAADRMADSIISHMHINPLQEELYRPVIPTKPSFVPTDSSVIISKQVVKPIIDSTKIKR